MRHQYHHLEAYGEFTYIYGVDSSERSARSYMHVYTGHKYILQIYLQLERIR